MKSNTMPINKDKLVYQMAVNGYSTRELCDKARIHYSTYRRITTGENISTHTIGKLTSALNCQAQDLI